MEYLKMYAISLIVFLAIDSVWLLFISKKLYRQEIGHLLSDTPNLIAAAVFYLIFLVGLIYFSVNPAVISGDTTKLIISAALFGLITYATYDLTNLATLTDWPVKITIIDLIWGTSLTTIVCYLTYTIYKFL